MPDGREVSAPLQEALDLHRAVPSPLLTFRVHVVPWLDVSHGTALTRKLEQLSGDGEWHQMRAVKTLAPQIPEKFGLYMFVWRPWVELRAAGGPPTHFPRVLY